uniref:NADH-quinone oxidoreductase subunit NuoK n=1 Tax=Solitalea canadensis TaxID=995 RepID=UPI000693F0FC
MSTVEINHVLLLAAILFGLGAIGVVIRRNVLFMLISVEVMLNAAGLAFITAGAKWVQADGQVMFLFILTMAAAEVSIGLALIMQIYHQHKTLDIDELANLKTKVFDNEKIT